jgi:hypothetical protein
LYCFEASGCVGRSNLHDNSLLFAQDGWDKDENAWTLKYQPQAQKPAASIVVKGIRVCWRPLKISEERFASNALSAYVTGSRMQVGDSLLVHGMIEGKDSTECNVAIDPDDYIDADGYAGIHPALGWPRVLVLRAVFVLCSLTKHVDVCVTIDWPTTFINAASWRL